MIKRKCSDCKKVLLIEENYYCPFCQNDLCYICYKEHDCNE